MADPISILAIAGLVYAGRKLSKSDEKYTVEGNSIQGQEEVLPPPMMIYTVEIYQSMIHI